MLAEVEVLTHYASMTHTKQWASASITACAEVLNALLASATCNECGIRGPVGNGIEGVCDIVSGARVWEVDTGLAELEVVTLETPMRNTLDLLVAAIASVYRLGHREGSYSWLLRRSVPRIDLGLYLVVHCRRPISQSPCLLHADVATRGGHADYD